MWIWISIPLLLAEVAEFGQAAHLVPGTFDWLDVMSYVLAAGAAMIFVKLGRQSALAGNNVK